MKRAVCFVIFVFGIFFLINITCLAAADTGFENVSVIEANGKLSCGDDFPYINKNEGFVEISSSEAHTGEKSLLVTPKQYTGALFKFNVKTNRLYEFSVYAKAHSDMGKCLINIFDKQTNVTCSFDEERMKFYDIDGYVNDQSGVDFTRISKTEWTQFRRYIYVPSETDKSIDIYLGLYSEGRTNKYYIDDVSLTETEQYFSAEFTTGSNMIDSAKACEEYYTAEFVFKDKLLIRQSAAYSLDKEYTGISIDTAAGKLSVAEGVSAEITVNAQVTVYTSAYNNTDKVTKTVSKKVSISPKIKSNISNISGITNEFESDVYSYYDIPFTEPLKPEVSSDAPSIVENIDGRLKLVRVTAGDKVYNFYADIYDENANMIYDGGFEDGVITELTSNQTVDISGDEAKDGYYCASVTLSRPYTPVYTTVKAKPGKLYIASAWIKLKSGSTQKNAFFMVGGAQIYKNDFSSVYEGDIFGDNNTNFLKTAVFSEDEWRQETRLFYVTEEKNVMVGFAHYGEVFDAYIDNFFVAELATTENVVNEIQKDSFGLINFQTEENGESYVNVLLKGNKSMENMVAVAADYDESGRLCSVDTEKIVNNGTYLFRFKKIAAVKKLFFWCMNSMTPLCETKIN